MSIPVTYEHLHERGDTVMASQSAGGALAMTWEPPAGMDRECIDLCVALNRIPGVETTWSCCGHGTGTYSIFFRVCTLEALQLVAVAADLVNRDDPERWYVIAQDRVGVFLLEGPAGRKGYEGAQQIAGTITRRMDHEDEAGGQMKLLP